MRSPRRLTSKLKFGFHTIHKWKQNLPDVIDEISRAGFEGFETFSWDLNPFYGKEKDFAALLSKKGIQLASIYTGGDGAVSLES
jgi:sugar phosphate isomerase/epimerase